MRRRLTKVEFMTTTRAGKDKVAMVLCNTKNMIPERITCPVGFPTKDMAEVAIIKSQEV